jgi:hypothetical protein
MGLMEIGDIPAYGELPISFELFGIVSFLFWKIQQKLK